MIYQTLKTYLLKVKLTLLFQTAYQTERLEGSYSYTFLFNKIF
jgi:hypothetical protein